MENKHPKEDAKDKIIDVIVPKCFNRPNLSSDDSTKKIQFRAGLSPNMRMGPYVDVAIAEQIESQGRLKSNIDFSLAIGSEKRRSVKLLGETSEHKETLKNVLSKSKDVSSSSKNLSMVLHSKEAPSSIDKADLASNIPVSNGISYDRVKLSSNS